MTHLLSIQNLSVDFSSTRGDSIKALCGVSLDLQVGEILGVVGESGAGKSLTGAAVVGLLPSNSKITAGEILFQGRPIQNLDETQLSKIRGKSIGFIFQDPLTSLNPLFTIGDQLVETIRRHLPLDKNQAIHRAIQLLEDTGISGASERLQQYPHQFSGGMRQRLVIALALAGDPELIIADEPTTALDVSIQAQIMTLLKKLCRQRGTAVLLITHDMGVIAETCDRVAVMYAGRVVEVGRVDKVIHQGRHPYTQGLMACIPKIDGARIRLAQIEGSMPRPGSRGLGCAFAPRCARAHERCTVEDPALGFKGSVDIASGLGHSVACFYPITADTSLIMRTTTTSTKFESESTVQKLALGLESNFSAEDLEINPSKQFLVKVSDWSKTYDISRTLFARMFSKQPPSYLHAVSEVSFEIKKGETFALVGESGCGKSSIAKTLVGLYPPSKGKFNFDGVDGTKLYKANQSLPIRKRVQMIFQDPYASLNPRWQVKDIVSEPMIELGDTLTPKARLAKVTQLLESVGLRKEDLVKYPHQFSGGQRQRISIARALATEPDFLICDEPTSALDVSVQAQVLNLMMDLQKQKNLTYLFISHNLAVVRHVSHRVGVMYLGRLVETSPTQELFTNPLHPYTKMLLEAIPRLEAREQSKMYNQGEIPNPINAPSGCSFHPRCPLANERCAHERPELQARGNIFIACHAVQENRV